MEQLIERIRTLLGNGGYPSEAQVSVSVVLPLLRALGWDDADPAQLCPEYGSGRGRVDFGLMDARRRPAVFIEVKGVGRSVEGHADRQLFEYAYREGVPLCVLTDGRDWNIYLPGEQGSYDDRRVHKLVLDERPVADCVAILRRYLDFERVRSGAAHEDARRDYRDARGRRIAEAALPQAWAELLSGPHEDLVDRLAERAEERCGIRPDPETVAAFLRARAGSVSLPGPPGHAAGLRNRPAVPVVIATPAPPPAQAADVAHAPQSAPPPQEPAGGGRAIVWTLFGERRESANAGAAMVEILRALVARDPSPVPQLAEAVRGRRRNHVARTPAEVYPERPDLARCEDIGAGWLVGLNISNRDKRRILLAACDAWGLRWSEDLAIALPNA